MTGYQVRETRHVVGGYVYRRRVPYHKQQFVDLGAYIACIGSSAA